MVEAQGSCLPAGRLEARDEGGPGGLNQRERFGERQVGASTERRGVQQRLEGRGASCRGAEGDLGDAARVETEQVLLALKE